MAARTHVVVRSCNGPKVDKWLVRTVGILVAAIGGALISAGVREKVNGETMGLPIGSATGLTAIDTVNASCRRISKIHLADAVVEAGVVVSWTGVMADG